MQGAGAGLCYEEKNLPFSFSYTGLQWEWLVARHDILEKPRGFSRKSQIVCVLCKIDSSTEELTYPAPWGVGGPT